MVDHKLCAVSFGAEILFISPHPAFLCILGILGAEDLGGVLQNRRVNGHCSACRSTTRVQTVAVTATSFSGLHCVINNVAACPDPGAIVEVRCKCVPVKDN